MGFDLSIIRITNQQLVAIKACVSRLHWENEANTALCESENDEPVDGLWFEQVFAEHGVIGNVWSDRETVFLGACYYVDPNRLSDQGLLLGITDAELTDNPLRSHCLPFEAYYDPTDHDQLTSLAPFEAYYAAAEPVNDPSFPDINVVCQQVSGVMDQRKSANLGYIEAIDPQQTYYEFSANLHLWEPVQQCMETLVQEQLLPDWPIKIFDSEQHRAAYIDDFQIGYSKLYLMQTVEIPIYLQALKQLSRTLLKRHFFMQRWMNREPNSAMLMPFSCWELRIVDKLILLFEQAVRDQDALVWYTW